MPAEVMACYVSLCFALTEGMLAPVPVGEMDSRPNQDHSSVNRRHHGCRKAGFCCPLASAEGSHGVRSQCLTWVVISEGQLILVSKAVCMYITVMSGPEAKDSIFASEIFRNYAPYS